MWTSADDIHEMVAKARREWWGSWARTWRATHPTLDPRPADLEAAQAQCAADLRPLDEMALRALRDCAFPIRVPKEDG